VALALGAAVNIEKDFVGFDFYAGDLNLVAEARCRTSLAQCVVPGAFVVLTVAVDNKFVGMRENNFGGGVFGGEAAFNLNALIEAQFIGKQIGAEGAEQKTREG
jgi:hypothetical protein